MRIRPDFWITDVEKIGAIFVIRAFFRLGDCHTYTSCKRNKTERKVKGREVIPVPKIALVAAESAELAHGLH